MFSAGGVDIGALGMARRGALRDAGSTARRAGGDPTITVDLASDGRGAAGPLRSDSQPSTRTKHVEAAVATSKTLGMGPSYAVHSIYTPDAPACLNLVGSRHVPLR
jgi:hypothetical protein